MMKALDYLYIGLYRLFMKTNEKDIAEFSALTFLTIGLAFYLGQIFYFIGFDPREYISVRAYGMVFGLVIGVAIYFTHLRGGRYKILYDELLKKPMQQQRRCSIISVLFVVSSLALMVIIKIATT